MLTARPHDDPALREACFCATRALCNTCGALVDSNIVFRDGAVFLVKWCLEHGRTEALVSSDADWYRRSLAYVKPGTVPREHSVPEHRACPSSCGLCTQHQQHTCVPLLEITSRCNMTCPICLVDGCAGRELSIPEVRSMVDALLRCEGRVNMLTLSGGEPTSHPDFLAVLDEVRRPEVGIVSVSTNGLRLAEEDALLRDVIARDVVISLQFDGIRPSTYEALRGDGAFAAVKVRLVDRVLALGGKLSLTFTMARGINEDEVGSALDLLFGHDNVLSLMVQPVSHAGRAVAAFPVNPLDVVTIPDVIARLVDGSRGVLAKSDFTPLPCSHPTCFALTYLLKLQDGGLVPVPRIVDADTYLDIIKNQALLSTDRDNIERVQDSLYRLWSSDGQVPNRDAILRTLRAVLLDLQGLGHDAGHREVLLAGTRSVKSIFIHHFMDRYTFDLSRAIKCCNHYPQPDGRLLPACIRNNGLVVSAPG